MIRYAYLVAVAIMLIGAFGMVRAKNLISLVTCLSVAQSGTYVLLVAVGFQRGAPAPVFGEPASPPTIRVTDPLVQAMALTDVVVSATVTALLLALTIQVAKTHGTIDPDELSSLRG
ncbi:sodium:proton antiporter [Pseudofrankia inefficax]|uniref:NADH-ubiquinone oxidoreductase chain 4L n=1 Tax=Pseudofrankia inefficax (strain DSM 45817 / CECT 9037 / DDB 130130 / EuI1c) TaxID=298654 RepID=E3J8G9_PSEI1|nr:NADH-quinone oxidoreductase subunit K [Pseudofrankia inefficax]ADP84503.1 NADH-ubiquinone oxidoreductase chain 4L [Pseudofrankia inefficax]